MKKVLLITNIPTPYRIPLFNELNSQLKQLGTTFKVLFGAVSYCRRKWEVDLDECEFDYDILSSAEIALGSSERTFLSYKGLVSSIIKCQPNVIITSGFSLASVGVCFYCFFRDIPYVIWSGSIENKGRYVSFSRKIVRRMLIKRAQGYIAYGTKAKELFCSLGAANDKVQIAINTVDTKYYEIETKQIRGNLKRKKNLKHLLYVGYLTSGKRIDHLFRALNILKNERQDFIFDLVGSGPGIENLKSLAGKLGITSFVNFEGFKQKRDLPYYFAQADCFLFPSEYDIWGLVVVEAMTAGLPCITSVHAGATHDLIEDGVTGFSMDFANTNKVAQRINWILENPAQATQVGENACRFISENASLLKSSQGFIKAIEGL